MTQHDFDATALFTLPPPHKDAPEERGLLIHDRPFVYDTLRMEYGIDINVSRGLNSIRLPEGHVEDVVRPEYSTLDSQDVKLRRRGSVALAEYAAFRPYGHPIATDTMVQSINPMNMRRFMRDKHMVGEKILTPLGVYRQSILVKNGDLPPGSAELSFASSLVVKPNGGFASRDIEWGTADDISRVLRLSTEDKLVEEKLNFSPPMPLIRGADDEQQVRIDAANVQGRNKELRLYSYGTAEWHPIFRVAEEGALKMKGDEWVYVDEDSVPEEAVIAADAIKLAIDDVAGDTDTILAVDMVYVSSESNPTPHWEAMEVNAEPFIPRPSINGEVGLRHTKKFISQVARIASRSATESVK